jgi:hypothetical protein
MKPVNKQDYVIHITRTYWTFWLWCLLVAGSAVNAFVVPSIFTMSIIIVNIYVLGTTYYQHKELKAEYDRRYPPTFNKSTYKPEETEQKKR